MGETKERRAQTDAQSTQTNTCSFNCTHQHSHRPSPSETIYEKDIYPTPSYLADVPKSSSMLACPSIMKNSPHCSPGRGRCLVVAPQATGLDVLGTYGGKDGGCRRVGVGCFCAVAVPQRIHSWPSLSDMWRCHKQ